MFSRLQERKATHNSVFKSAMNNDELSSFQLYGGFECYTIKRGQNGFALSCFIFLPSVFA